MHKQEYLIHRATYLSRWGSKENNSRDPHLDKQPYILYPKYRTMATEWYDTIYIILRVHTEKEYIQGRSGEVGVFRVGGGAERRDGAEHEGSGQA